MRTLLVLLMLALPALAQNDAPEPGGPDAAASARDNQWPQYVAIMAEIAPFVEEAKAADRAIRREGNEWAGYGFSTLYWEPMYGDRAHLEAERARIEAVLDDWTERGAFAHTAALSELHTAVPPSIALEAPPPPQLFLVRELARAQIARMHLAAKRGDNGTRLTALEEILAMHRLHAGYDSTLPWLVAEADVRDACAEMLRTLLRHPMPTDAALARADEAIVREAMDGWVAREDLLAMIRRELHGLIDRAYGDDGLGGGEFLPEAYNEVFAGAIGGVDLDDYGGPFAPRGEAEAWVDRHVEQLTEMLSAKGRAYLAAERATRKHVKDAGPALPIAGDMGGVYLRVARDSRKLQVLVAGTRVVLAIERYRLAHGGEPPATLADLGPLLPDGLDADPLDGEPWVYTPRAMETDEYENPLLPGSIAWPYTLRGRALPGVESPVGYARHASEGLLITPPIQGPEFDPEPTDTEGN